MCSGCRSLKCRTCAKARIVRSSARSKSGGFLDFGFGGAFAGADEYPSNLNLSRWWRDYSALPWKGSPSRGVSGAHNLTSDGGAGVGPLLKTRPTAEGGTFGGGGGRVDIFGTGYYSAWFLIRPYWDGSHTINFCSSPFIEFFSTGTLNDFAAGSGDTATDLSNPSANVWSLIQVRYAPTSGGGVRFNGGAWSNAVPSTAALPPFPSNTAFTFGDGGNTNVPGVVTVAEFGAIQSVLSDHQFDRVRSYCRSRYGVSV